MKRAMRPLMLFGAVALAGTMSTGWTASAAEADPREADRPLDAATRTQVIDQGLKNLLEAYVFPDVAKKMEKAVRERQKRKEYDGIGSSRALARKLTEDLQAVSHDKHLRVFFDPEPHPVRAVDKPTPEEIEQQRAFGRRVNHGFERVERLRGNIGYLDLRFFADPEVAGPTCAAAMNFLHNTDALIIDLRKNGGGTPAMIAFLTSYLFDGEPVHLNDIYWRPDNTTHQWWTLPWVPGERYAGKDVYVLTSNRTFSGAEEFSYNLKNLRRATLLGETTGGGAHPVQGYPITPHFVITVPAGRAINPITKTNWEGTGVKPDLEMPAAEALAAAHVMALDKQIERVKDEGLRRALMEAREDVKRELAELKKKG